MAKLDRIPAMGYEDKYYRTVIGIPERPHDNTFDSEFERSVDEARNCTLKSDWKLCFRQISPSQLTGQVFRNIAIQQGIAVPAGDAVGFHADYDKNWRLIKDWSGQEWQNFLQGVRNQAMLWD